MIQVICPECKGKGKVPCPVCREDSKNIVDCRDNKESQEKETLDNGENNEDNKNIVDCRDDKESQEKETLCKCEDREDSKNIVDCRDDKESQEKKCPECGGTGEVLCTACMGGGIMDTNAFA